MIEWAAVLAAALLGLVTTSSSIIGAAIGLYVPFSKRVLACILAFASGALISARAAPCWRWCRMP
jgi:zinc transporter ZupT